MKVHTQQTIKRLEQLTSYIHKANEHTYLDHLRGFCLYCETTPAVRHVLGQLPEIAYDWDTQWHKIEWPSGGQGCAFRWSALEQLAGVGSLDEFLKRIMRIGSNLPDSQRVFAQEIVTPVSDYLVNSLEDCSTMLYLLWRYKRWAEWFEAERLREVYGSDGENGLDHDLRRFLFESGVDHPFSQPRSPSGQADVVAGLETHDPLVLEIKVWDSQKPYKVDRVRDGLRQAIAYTDDYGKDVGYVVVFNLDPLPLQFIGEANSTELPARIVKDHTYYFLSINIAEQKKPASQRDKGKPVKRNEVRLSKLWDSLAG